MKSTLANFPLLFLGHPLSPRYSTRERLSTSTTHLTGGQKRSVESSAGPPPPRTQTAGLWYISGLCLLKTKKPKRQNKSLRSTFRFVMIGDDFKAVVMFNLKKKKRFELENKEILL